MSVTTPAAAGVSTLGVKLGYKTSSSATSYTDLYSISRVPELDAAPEQIDVTPLSSGSRIYVPGVKDTQTLEFEGWMGKWGAAGTAAASLVDEFAALRQLTSSNVHFWKVTFGDGSSATFEGYPYARSAGAEVNNGQGYILAIVLSSGITYAAPPA